MRGMGEGNFLKKVPVSHPPRPHLPSPAPPPLIPQRLSRLSNPCSGFGWRGGLLRMEGKREGMESKAPVWS